MDRGRIGRGGQYRTDAKMPKNGQPILPRRADGSPDLVPLAEQAPSLPWAEE